MLDKLMDRPWLLNGSSVRIDNKDCEGAQISVVRDDLLHPYAGGNKLRKLDAWIPDVVNKGITDVVTCGGVQSSHAASVAALCADEGVEAHVFLRGEPLEHPTGNNLISHCFGNVQYVERDRYADRSFLQEEADKLSRSGRKVSVIPEGAGGILALYGLIRQVHGIMMAVEDPYSNQWELIVDSGTGTTAAGLALGIALLELPWTVSGICLMQDAMESYQEQSNKLWTLWGQYEEMPKRHPVITWNQRVHPRRFGGIVEGEFERCRQVAQQTGVLFDPIYTLASWDAIRIRKRSNRKKCMLVHTGGGLNIFGVASRTGVQFGR